MPLFLTVREGPIPEESKVVFASADSLLVCALGEALAPAAWGPARFRERYDLRSNPTARVTSEQKF